MFVYTIWDVITVIGLGISLALICLGYIVGIFESWYKKRKEKNND